MSDQASTLVETQAADEEICKEEIAQMGKLKTQKDWIIKQAAIKLENSGKYDDDLAEIGNRIHKLWKDHISKSYVYKVLD
ncbi:MAG: hypothetical protein IS860_11185, partial [Nitrosopumilus sp.]|nr:hypothetical protein [Nitrosopumilus sp.]